MESEMMNPEELRAVFAEFDGNADQSFWHAFPGIYPPPIYDEAFAALQSAVPFWVSEAIGEAGVDLEIYLPGDTYPSGRRVPDGCMEMWEGGDGFLESAQEAARQHPRCPVWIAGVRTVESGLDDPAWESDAVFAFCEAIALGTLAEVPAQDQAAFLAAWDAWCREKEGKERY